MNFGGGFDLVGLRRQLEELDVEMARPDLWDDREVAQAVGRRKAAVERELALYDRVESSLDDAEVLLVRKVEAGALHQHHAGFLEQFQEELPVVRDGTGGPEWFRRMDSNRDGDVSPREFLGSPETFDRFDLNGNGLLSADEAGKEE